MLRAGSLYFAIFISFIVTLLLGSIILLTFYNNRNIEIQAKKTQAESNAGSGIILALYDTSLLSNGNSVVQNLFDADDSSDQVLIKKSYWGVFQIIKSTAKWKDFEVTKIALAGTDISDNEPIALYMADKERYLSVSGNTSLVGTCYLPKLGVRMAYIEGQNFIGEKVVKGEIKTSNNQLPEISDVVLKMNDNYFKGKFIETDSLLNMDQFQLADSMHCSFKNNTITLYSENPITLDHISLKGNIHVVSSKAIYVTENANCENIILYAPLIYFNSGYRGSIQAFASDTLITGDFCQFQYPSCLAIINEDSNTIYMSIGQSTSVVGCILLDQKKIAVHEPYLKIGKQAVIHGLLYCTGLIELQGKAEGSLYCHGFGLNTGSAYYENYLLNASIDRLVLSQYYAGTFLFNDFSHSKLMLWLD